MTAQLFSDIHHYDQRLAVALSNLEEDKKVLESNRKKIKQFLEYIRAEGLSVPRQVRYVYVLRKISRLLGREFYRTTKTDMVAVVSELEKQDTAYDTKLSEKKCIKRFYKWLRNTEDDQISNGPNVASSISVWDVRFTIWEITQTKAAASGGRFHVWVSRVLILYTSIGI